MGIDPLFQVRIKRLLAENGHHSIGPRTQVTLKNGIAGYVAYTENPEGVIHVHAGTESGKLVISLSLPHLTRRQLPLFETRINALALEYAYLEQLTQGASHDQPITRLGDALGRPEAAIDAIEEAVIRLRHKAGLGAVAASARYTPESLSRHLQLPVKAFQPTEFKPTTPSLPHAAASWVRSSTGSNLTLFRYNGTSTDVTISFANTSPLHLTLHGRVTEQQALTLANLADIFHVLNRTPPALRGAPSADDMIQLYQHTLSPKHGAIVPDSPSGVALPSFSRAHRNAAAQHSSL